MVIPLKDANKASLRLKLAFECVDEATRKSLEERDAAVRKIIEEKTRELTLPEARSIEGKMRLREEIILAVNAELPQGGVRELYYTEFVTDPEAAE
jgi:flagellar FliL protein